MLISYAKKLKKKNDLLGTHYVHFIYKEQIYMYMKFSVLLIKIYVYVIQNKIKMNCTMI